jgi:hypothetical protein
MLLTIDVAARLIHLTLKPNAFTARKPVTALSETLFHSPDLHLLTSQSARFASGQFARPDTIDDASALIILTCIYAASGLRRSVGR